MTTNLEEDRHTVHDDGQTSTGQGDDVEAAVEAVRERDHAEAMSSLRDIVYFLGGLILCMVGLMGFTLPGAP